MATESPAEKSARLVDEANAKLARKRPATVPHREITMRYMEFAVPAGEDFKIPYRGTVKPEVQILGVDRREGTGFGNYTDVYRVVLIWR